MNDLQTKLDLFLSGGPEIPRHIVFTASQMFNEKLSKFNYKKLGSSNGLPSLAPEACAPSAPRAALIVNSG